jgi:hypothetical protein
MSSSPAGLERVAPAITAMPAVATWFILEIHFS